MRPKNAKPAIAHALPKIHKEFLNIPEFRPIIATKGTSHSLAGKYLVGLLDLLTTSEFSLKDSFDAANYIFWIYCIFWSRTIIDQYSHQTNC